MEIPEISKKYYCCRCPFYVSKNYFAFKRIYMALWQVFKGTGKTKLRVVNQVATKLNENLFCFLATLLTESLRVQTFEILIMFKKNSKVCFSVFFTPPLWPTWLQGFGFFLQKGDTCLEEVVPALPVANYITKSGTCFNRGVGTLSNTPQKSGHKI